MVTEVAVANEQAPVASATTHQWPKCLPAMVLTSIGVAIVLTYWRVVRFSAFVSDASDYWSDSLSWEHPFNRYHLPGYPLVLALARGATGGAIRPIALMTIVTVSALLTGVYATYTLATIAGLSDRVSLAAAAAFGLWPFVGVTYAALPVSDPLALSLLLWGAVCLLRRRFVLCGLMFGLVAITHKGLWPVVGILIVGQILVRERRRTGLMVAGVALVPLVMLWLDGVLTGHGANWLLFASAENAARPWQHRSLLVLDGLLGGSLYGDWIERGRVVAAIMAFALALGVLSTHVGRWREPPHLVAAAFAAQIVFMALTLNQHLIWACVRFSGLLAVPAACAVSRRVDAWSPRHWRRVSACLALALIATQVVTAAEGARRGWAGTL